MRLEGLSFWTQPNRHGAPGKCLPGQAAMNDVVDKQPLGLTGMPIGTHARTRSCARSANDLAWKMSEHWQMDSSCGAHRGWMKAACICQLLRGVLATAQRLPRTGGAARSKCIHWPPSCALYSTASAERATAPPDFSAHLQRGGHHAKDAPQAVAALGEAVGAVARGEPATALGVCVAG